MTKQLHIVAVSEGTQEVIYFLLIILSSNIII